MLGLLASIQPTPMCDRTTDYADYGLFQLIAVET